MKTLLLVLLLALTTALFAQDLFGACTGKVKTGTPGGAPDKGGSIINEQNGGKLNVTAGPNAEEQFPANNFETASRSTFSNTGGLATLSNLQSSRRMSRMGADG
jgi:hypothetical protein